MDKVESFSKSIIDMVRTGKIKDKHQLGRAKNKLAGKMSLPSLPSNPTILSFAPSPGPKIKGILGLKPTRSLSGIAVVAVMAAPHKCPGKCIYCPSSLINGKELPKSYTGYEPAAMRAVSSNFDPKIQVCSRLKQLEETGHSTEKIELVIMGGTFLSQKKQVQEKFMVSCINSVTNSRAKTLEGAKARAFDSARRITGITFETRPDYCGRKEIDSMLSFGGTRCELGVQSVRDSVYKKIGRGHTVKDVVKATERLKDSAFKLTYHFMPGLPGSDLDSDERQLREIFSDQRFMPDSLKIYPCLVLPGTELFKEWKSGSFNPMQVDEAIELVLRLKKFIPRWSRIMRIQRDIPSNLVEAGVLKTNLRQMVQQEAEKKGIECRCIRCREAGLNSRNSQVFNHSPKQFIESYEASNGTEKFISFEDSSRKNLFGFVRLRFPSNPFRKEILENTCLVRELRVFGKALALGERTGQSMQHRGLGKKLLLTAEEIALSEFGAKKLVVISSIGTKQYYLSLGFQKDGCYVSKDLN